MESYITPILLSYLDKYVRDFNPADAQVSLWSGGVTLNNLILKPDILQKELHVPFTLASGRIHELKIQVPWMKIVSEPILITIDTMECIISHQSGSDQEEIPLDIPENVPEAPPGYARGLVRKIVNNIALRIQHLIFKYIYDDVVLSVNVNHIKADSAHADWNPGFADVSGSVPLFRRLIILHELTLCLDKSDSDGRIRHYHEPLLYRCQLTFKVETSPERTRVWVQGNRLAFGLCNDQITLLQSILHDKHWSRPTTPSRAVPVAPKIETQDDSWSAWAWSWLPAWSDPSELVVTPPPQFRTTFFSVHVETVTFAFKVSEGTRGRRAHSVLQAEMTSAVAKASLRLPFVMSLRCGVRALSLYPQHRCTCGYPISELEPRPFLLIDPPAAKDTPLLLPDEENLEAYGDGDTALENALDAVFDKAWSRSCPALVVHVLHKRTQPDDVDIASLQIPHSFENSDWQESVLIRMKLGPTVILANASLFHRLHTIVDCIAKLPKLSHQDVKTKPLTVEELDALSDNLPIRSIFLHWKEVRINIAPWDHPTPVPMPPVLVQMQPQLIQVHATMPLYPRRVCAAASQLPQMFGPVWRGAQARIHINFDNVQIFLIKRSAEEGKYTRSVGDITFRIAAKVLLNPHFFISAVPLKQGFHLAIKELHLMGSVPRIYSSAVIVSSFVLRDKNIAKVLYTTCLIDDAMKDSQAVALDVTLESFDWKCFFTDNIMANVVMLQAVRLMMHENQMRRFDTQVWILSAPEDTRSTELPYLRVAFQWATFTSALSLSYVGAWISPASICLDPIFALAIAYRPLPCQVAEMPPVPTARQKVSSASSSGRGTGTRANVEVHSLGTVTHSQSTEYIPAVPTSTRSEAASDKTTKEDLSFRKAYKLLRRLVCCVEISPITVYVPTQSVDAVDCDSMRGALEHHASDGGKVLGLGTGRINMTSNTSKKTIWNIVNHEGPTIIPEDYELEIPLHESFPWKLKVTELVFFTLSGESAEAKCILEPLTSSATVSFVVRQVEHEKVRPITPKPQPKAEPKVKDNMGFFKGRKDMSKVTPKSLMEFIRGPKAIIEVPLATEKVKDTKEPKKKVSNDDSWISDEDLDRLQLSVYLYADTPSFALRLSLLQVNILTDAVHCLIHLIHLILANEDPVFAMSAELAARSGHQSMSEADSIQSMISQRSRKEDVSSSHLISIFERPSEIALRTMQVTVWVQWVVSRISAQVTSKSDRLSIMFEDSILTVDMQPNYLQIKFNISTANASYSTPKMKVGRGKLLVVRERRPETNKETDFVRCTITKAMLSCLPNEWEDTTLPSRYSNKWAKMQTESVLEVCAKVAALDLEIGPSAIQIIFQSVAAIMTCVKDPRYIKKQSEPVFKTHKSIKPWSWPLVFLHCGGIKIMIPTDDEACAQDISLPVELPHDTITFEIGKITVCPQPEHPICRQSDSVSGSMGAEGRQYELKAKDCSITTTLWNHYIEYLQQTEHRDNPAAAWNQRLPPFTPLLHRLDLSLIFAPPFYAGNTLICGPGLEVNVLSDCVLELSVGQIKLLTVLTVEFINASSEAKIVYSSTQACPYCEDFQPESSHKEETSSANLSSSSHNIRTGIFQEALEVYVTTGLVQLSVYTRDDGGEAADILRHNILQADRSLTGSPNMPSSLQLPRSPDQSSPDLLTDALPRRHTISNTIVPVFQIILSQPNLFIWNRRYRNTLQASVFDAWVGIGAGWVDHKITDSSPLKKEYFQSFIKTAKGTPDPATDIWPSLLTIRCETTSADDGDTIVVEVDRPICLKMSTDLLARYLACYNILSRATTHKPVEKFSYVAKKRFTPLVLREIIGTRNIEMSFVQLCLLAPEGSISVSTLTGQIAGGLRPARFISRALVKCFTINIGAIRKNRTSLLLPMTFGLECEYRWESWRSETGDDETPDIIGMIHFQDIELDARPEHIEVLQRVYDTIALILDKHKYHQLLVGNTSEVIRLPAFNESTSSISTEEVAPPEEPVEYFYKDDLRSGAFKVATGPQVPMPYQITLHANSMAWRYPHPRAVTRLIVFPTPPPMPKNTECTLEHFCMAFSQWQELARFTIPEEGYNEIKLITESPVAVFAQTWRVRAVGSLTNEHNRSKRHNRFNDKNFKPTSNPFHRTYLYDEAPAAEMLSGALVGVVRVDSYFAPLFVPRCQLGLLITKMQANFFNKVYTPSNTLSTNVAHVAPSKVKSPESRKVLSVMVNKLRFNRQQLNLSLNSASYSLLDTMLSAVYVDSETELVSHLVGPLHVRMALSYAKEHKARLCIDKVLLKLHPARIQGLWALAEYWTGIIKHRTSTTKLVPYHEAEVRRTCIEPVYWLVNECTVTVLLSQEESEDVVRLAAATRREFFWLKPSSPRLLRCSVSSVGQHWSRGVDLETEGTSELCLDYEKSVYAYVTLKKEGCTRTLTISGRIVLANMLSQPLVYRVRVTSETSEDKLEAVAELPAGCHNLGRLCGNQPMVLKLRLPSPLGTGWSGDIPLEECPRRDVPWLVKMPSASVGKFIAVWCRVVRGRSDKRLVATVWPLYIMRSHLPLDVNISVQSSMIDSATQSTVDVEAAESAGGRGAHTQLFLPGTTGTRHTLLLQYKDYDSPVSNESVDLMYSAAGEVFKKSPVYDTIGPVLEEMKKWQKKVTSDPLGWPYSRVMSHRTGSWTAAPAQPRTDITLELVPVQCGGACSVECRLLPLALVCNAMPLTVTLRTHDGAPLASIPPCSVLAPPVTAIKKPFYISIQLGTETYVSWPLEVWMKEPGRYGEPPPGRFAVDKPVRLAIACGRKVILLTLYYEIINGINILGFSPTYIIRNLLPHPIVLAAIATPKTQNQLILRPKNFHFFDSMDPLRRGCGRPLSHWQIRERWRGSTAAAGELSLYLSVTLAAQDTAYVQRVPIAVDALPSRRAFSIQLDAGEPVAIVVTQQCVEDRTIITIATDPCPQYKICNMSSHALLIAEADSNGEAKQECEGVKWRLHLQPRKVLYYSTQSYCGRHPNATALSAIPLPEPMFLFAPIVVEELEPSWSIPVSGGNGERLVNLTSNVAIKLKVILHPHSSTVYIQDVHQNEVSASDIRKRLSQEAIDLERRRSSQEGILSRTNKQCETKFLFHITSVTRLQPIASTERPVVISDVIGQQTLLNPIYAEDETSFEGKDNPRLFTIRNFAVYQATGGDAKTPRKQAPVENVPVADISEQNPDTSPILEQTGSELSIFTTPAPSKRVTVKFQEPQEDIDVTTAPQEPLLTKNSNPTANEGETVSASLAETVAEVEESPGFKSSVKDISEIKPAESNLIMPYASFDSDSSTEFLYPAIRDRPLYEFKAICEGFLLELAEHVDATPLLRIYIDWIKMNASVKSIGGSVNINLTEIQVENGGHSSGLYDFPVVLAGGSAISIPEGAMPLLWSLCRGNKIFDSSHPARIQAVFTFESWNDFTELTEVEISCGNFSLYIEDSYVTAVSKLLENVVSSIPFRHRKITIPTDMIPLPLSIILEADGLVNPLRLRKLYIAPIETCLTMHTAVRMYIAVDHSKLHLNAFKCVDLMTSPQKLAHSLTLHYLSAVIFGAAWVVGGLELLGAPSSLASRVSSARGGVASVAKAAAAGALRSLTALADSLARNLDLLAGDEDHTRRAAALRRTAPASFLSGIATGATNFALNMLGAVGGLAHHPVVGVGVGEGGAALGLRRGLVGALAKPLSGTADLLAYAGTGLLCQAGWDPNPKRRAEGWAGAGVECALWERESVRWQRQLGDAQLLCGADVFFDETHLVMLITSKMLLLSDPESHTVVRQVEISSFTVLPEVHDNIIALQLCAVNEFHVYPNDDIDEFDAMNIDQATMARVAKFAGAEEPQVGTSSGRIVAIRILSKNALAIHTLLLALTLASKNTYFRIF